MALERDSQGRKFDRVQVAGSYVAVGGVSVWLSPDGETLVTLAADQPTAANAHAAVPFCYWIAAGSPGTVYRTDGTNWNVV